MYIYQCVVPIIPRNVLPRLTKKVEVTSHFGRYAGGLCEDCTAIVIDHMYIVCIHCEKDT